VVTSGQRGPLQLGTSTAGPPTEPGAELGISDGLSLKSRNRKGREPLCRLLPQVSTWMNQAESQSGAYRVRLRGRPYCTRHDRPSHVEEGVRSENW